MRGKTIVVLESRAGEQLVESLRRRGALPIWAPALAEEPDVDHEAIRSVVDASEQRAPALAIFQTGVGATALFKATDSLGLTDRFLAILQNCQVAVRGPKPLVELKRRGVRIDAAASAPFTTAQLLEAIRDVPVSGARVLVQRYGDTNRELANELESRGATVLELASYRWALPPDRAPLLAALAAIRQRTVDAVVFTSAAQAQNLLVVAREAGEAQALGPALESTLVASIGPVCSAALRDLGITVGLEASPPKLGPLVAALEAALQ